MGNVPAKGGPMSNADQIGRRVRYAVPPPSDFVTKLFFWGTLALQNHLSQYGAIRFADRSGSKSWATAHIGLEKALVYSVIGLFAAYTIALALVLIDACPLKSVKRPSTPRLLGVLWPPMLASGAPVTFSATVVLRRFPEKPHRRALLTFFSPRPMNMASATGTFGAE